MTDHLTETHKVMAEAIADPDSIESGLGGLVGKLMHANLRDYQGTTQMLLENYQSQIADLKAELAAIRITMSDLFSGDYMPNESAIQRAVFYPNRDLVERCREAELREMKRSE